MIQKQRGLRPSPSEDEASLRQGSRRMGRRRFGPETHLPSEETRVTDDRQLVENLRTET